MCFRGDGRLLPNRHHLCKPLIFLSWTLCPLTQLSTPLHCQPLSYPPLEVIMWFWVGSACSFVIGWSQSADSLKRLPGRCAPESLFLKCNGMDSGITHSLLQTQSTGGEDGKREVINMKGTEDRTESWASDYGWISHIHTAYVCFNHACADGD